MTEPERKLSDKAVEYIESTKVCLCFHIKEDHENGRGTCQYVDEDNCEEFKPENGERLWAEASEKDRLRQW